MNPYAIPYLLVAAVNLGLFAYVLHASPKGLTRRRLVILAVPLVLWPVTEFLFISSSTPEAESLLARTSWSLVAFLALGFLHYANTLHESTPRGKELSSLLFLLLVTSAIAILVIRTDYVITGATLRVWGLSDQSLPRFDLFGAYVCFLLLCAVATALQRPKTPRGKATVPFEHLSAGITLPIGATLATQVILPRLNIDVMPVGALFTMAVPILIVLHVVRYRTAVRVPPIATETVLNALSDSVFIVDPDGKILSVNRSMKEMLGYDESELVGRPLNTIVAEGQMIYLSTGWLLNGSQVRDRSLVFQTKSAKEVPVSLTASPIRDKNSVLRGLVGVARDARRVTTLEQMVKSSVGQLKESQEKYRMLVEKSLDGIYIIQDNKIQFANARFQEMSGYTEEELEKMDFWELVAPESREIVKERGLKRLRGEDPPERYEFRALRKDGKVIDVEALATGIEYEGKRAIQGYIRDITERKKLREKLAGLYELASQLSLSLNLDEICQRVLKIASEVLDFDNCAIMLLDEELNELSIKAQMGYPVEVEALRISLTDNKGLTADVARTGRPIYIPDVTTDGRYVEGLPGARSEMAVPLAVKNRVIGVLNVESRKSDAFTEQDIQLLGTLGYHTSIAIQTSRLFEKLAEKASELSAVIEIARALTSKMDIEVLRPMIMKELGEAISFDLGTLYLYDDKEGRLVIASQEGLSREEALERERTAMERHPGKVFQTKTPLLVADTTDDPRVSYLESMRKPASVLYVPVIFQDKALGVIGLASFEKDHFNERHLSLSKAIASEVAIAIENANLVKDLATAKVSLEKLNEELETKVVERTRALEEAQGELLKKEKLATVGQLAGSVAHELRNPLSVMRNSLYCINQRINQEDKKVLRHLELIDGQISRADLIIEDLLEYSRSKEPRRQETELNSFIEKALRESLVPESIKVIKRLGKDLPRVHVDLEQMVRVVASMVNNAVEAMPDGGELLFESEMRDGTPVVRIADTGHGIPAEDLSKIFQPLFTTKARGIGLGLALSRNLSEVNGVQIEVSSKVGEGSTFALVFGTECLSTCEKGGNNGREIEDTDSG